MIKFKGDVDFSPVRSLTPGPFNAPANTGDPNPLIAGLKPTGTIINCPVIAQTKNP